MPTRTHGLGSLRAKTTVSLAIATLFAVVFLVQASTALAVVDESLAAPPVAVDDAVTVKTETQVTFFVLDNDTDADGDPLELTAPSGPIPTLHGTVECQSWGECTYQSNPGYLGPDGFDYTVSDGVDTDTGHVAITVSTNTPPVANDDSLAVKANTAGTVFVLDNDFDPDFDELTVTTPNPPAGHGTVSCDEAGECLYTPAADYVGPDGFDYTISDGLGGADTAHVTIDVVPNTPPVASDDAYARADEAVLDLLFNDFDDDGDSLQITSVTQPAFGTATINDGADGTNDTVTYSQTSNFGASDSFTYTITDDGGDTATATVTLDPCPAVASALDHGGLVVAERWSMCSSTLANAAVGPTTTVLPPFNGTSVLLTSGSVAEAPGPNDETGAGQSNRTEGRGSFDPSILRLDLLVPAGANCLSFDLAFQSEEYPEFVNQDFNDGFLAELDVSNWSIEDAVITAPNNFAFDSVGGIVSVNGSFFEPDRVITDTGAEYDGSTPLLSVRTPVTPGAHVLYLSIFDAGDGILDSSAFVDRLQASTAGPGGCAAGANEPPVAVDDTLTTPEDTQADVNVLANDSDPDAHALTVTTLAPTAEHGTVSCTAAGVCTYTPNADYHGADSFSYSISDGHGGTDTAAVSITVTPVNDDPEATADVISTTQGVPGAANVLANDFDVDGDTLTIQGFTQGMNGTVACAGTDCTYAPNPGFSGPDSFTYTVSDGHGGTDVATVAVTVAPTNGPPVADDDSLTTAEDTSGNVNVLDGDTDPDGDTLTVTTPNPAAAHGTVSCTAAGVCTYTPNANFNGSDSFTYTVSDGNGGSDTGTVSVTVTPVHDDPNAVNDTLTTDEDTQGGLNVLTNDSDVDGDPLTVTTLNPTAAHGTVSCTAAGVCTYTPNANYNGPDSFQYSISDGQGGTDAATVNVAVTAVNDPPVADDDSLTTAEDTPGQVDVLAGDTDVDSDPLSITTLAPTATNGTVSCTAAGICTYTPNANFNGSDSFSYTVSDGNGGSDTATVSVTVTPVNDAPNAVNDSLTTAEDTPGQVNVLANDTDVDGDTLTVTTLTPTAGHGTVSCTAAGMCTYTPAPGYSGPDSFDYSISDGQGGSDTATVDVTVTPDVPTNNPPTAADDTVTTAEDTASAPLDVLGNDTDPDGDSLQVTTLAPAAPHGTVACTAAGMCTYTPDANYNGSDSFDYSISDGRGGVDTGTVTVTVTPVNDSPVAGDDELTTAQDTAGTVDVLVDDTDVDGDTLTVTTLAPTAGHGTVACTAAGDCTYTPDAGYFGPDTFSYAISDGNGGADTADVAVTVTEASANEPPSCANVKPSRTKLWPPNHKYKLVALRGATDPDGDPLTFQITKVTQDESVKSSAGKGDRSPDAKRVPGRPTQINLRAERKPGGDGRVYRISYRVEDGNGGVCTGVEKVQVRVKKHKPAIDSDKFYNSFG